MGGRLSSIAAVALLLGLGVAALSCKRDPAADQDRTVERLREIGQAQEPAEPPHARLAELATGEEKARVLPLPEPNPTVHLGGLALKLGGLEGSHQVKAGALELTSLDLFLGVTLAAQNVGKAAVQADFSLAKVVDLEETQFEIAPDVQRGAGTRELERTFAPGERAELTLYFEVPPSSIGQGLSLILPAGAVPGAASDAHLPLDSHR